MGKVINLFQSSLDPDDVLEKAKNNYDGVILIGIDQDDDLDVRSSKSMKKNEMLWVLESVKLKLLQGDYD